MCMCIRHSRLQRARRSTSSQCSWLMSRVSSIGLQASLLAEVCDRLHTLTLCMLSALPAARQVLIRGLLHPASSSRANICRACTACVQVPTLNRWRLG